MNQSDTTKQNNCIIDVIYSILKWIATQATDCALDSDHTSKKNIKKMAHII